MCTNAVTRCDVLVLGAGAAGISASRKLFEALPSREVIILEARHRVGGRAHTSDELNCGVALDHGAQWIHGDCPEHPMVVAGGIVGMQRCVPGDPMQRHFVCCDGSQCLKDDADIAWKAYATWCRITEVAAEQLGEAQDCTWTDALIQHESDASGKLLVSGAVHQLLLNQCALDEMKLEQVQSVLHHLTYSASGRYVPLDKLSVRHSSVRTNLKGPNADLVGGYGGLLASLAGGLDVRFGRVVTGVSYETEDEECACAQDHRIVVSCKVGQAVETYVAHCCVVTLPLGVLRANDFFQPPLPPSKITSLRALGIGLVNKLEILWAERWWPREVGVINIVSKSSTPTYHPWPFFLEPAAVCAHVDRPAVLVCFLTGSFAEEVESMDEEAANRTCLCSLRSAFPNYHIPEPRSVHMTRWKQDDLAKGAMTFYEVGSGPMDVHTIAEAIGKHGSLIFAGEHTCDNSQLGLDMGTVHGAWLSGMRAAADVLDSFRKAGLTV